MVLSHAVQQPITIPDRIVVVFIGDIARVGLVKADKICSVLHINEGAQFRTVLRAIHGQSAQDTGA